jgi:hypothetical protein
VRGTQIEAVLRMSAMGRTLALELNEPPLASTGCDAVSVRNGRELGAAPMPAIGWKTAYGRSGSATGDLRHRGRVAGAGEDESRVSFPRLNL